MKYIDERRMRFGYIGLFVFSVALIGAAFWDYTYNNEALLNWFISALGGLLLIAIFFFIATELILKDALDLRPKRVAVGSTDEDHGVMPAHNLTPESRMAAKATMTADTAASLSMPELKRPTIDPAASRGDAGRGGDWHPHVQAPVAKPVGKKEIIRIDAPKKEGEKTETTKLSQKIEQAKIDAPKIEAPKIEAPKRAPAKIEAPKPEVVKEVIKIEMPEPVTINAEPKDASLAKLLTESPAAVPKPKKVQPAPHSLNLQTMAYELGSSQFRVPRGSKGHRNPHAVLESTRVLCGDCGLYFRVDLDRARPMSVQCAQCNKDLGLSGARLEAEHVKMRCRFCGDFLQMPRASEHKSTQCATCGQING